MRPLLLAQASYALGMMFASWRAFRVAPSPRLRKESSKSDGK